MGGGEKSKMSDSWKLVARLVVLRKLRERNSKETSCFKELILSRKTKKKTL